MYVGGSSLGSSDTSPALYFAECQATMLDGHRRGVMHAHAVLT